MERAQTDKLGYFIGSVTGAVAVFVVLAVLAYCGYYLLSWAIEQERLRDIAWKESCVARGGTVTETIGGFSKGACTGAITFSR